MFYQKLVRRRSGLSRNVAELMITTEFNWPVANVKSLPSHGTQSGSHEKPLSTASMKTVSWWPDQSGDAAKWFTSKTKLCRVHGLCCPKCYRSPMNTVNGRFVLHDHWKCAGTICHHSAAAWKKLDLSHGNTGLPLFAAGAPLDLVINNASYLRRWGWLPSRDCFTLLRELYTALTFWLQVEHLIGNQSSHCLCH